MFISTTGFKKLVKSAYNTGGLTVGASAEEYLFQGATWVMRIGKEHLPNKEKAAVVELVGELPAAGEVFKAVKKCPIQYLAKGNPVWDIGSQFFEAKEQFNVTKAVFEVDEYLVRVLQNKQNNLCIPINETFTGIISIDAIDKENEDLPEGPVRRSDGDIMYWKNNAMVFAACIIDCGEESPLAEYLRLLTNIELPKKEMIY